jgi:hypothetical protein
MAYATNYNGIVLVYILKWLYYLQKELLHYQDIKGAFESMKALSCNHQFTQVCYEII